MTKNVLLILTDQERDSGAFDPPGMAHFRAQCLPQRARLAREGVRFTQHRISTSACVPSRATLLTGLSPWVHGMRQTDGFAKTANDAAMRWLEPHNPDTLGHRFEAAGYDTAYVGKWHLSHALAANDPLSPWGFHHWQGPEPHGADPKNNGLARDGGYLEQALRWLQERARSKPSNPFFLVISLVNPHDIVFWPAWSILGPRELDLEGIPEIGAGPSDTLICPNESPAVSQLRHHYPTAYGPRAIVSKLYQRKPEAYRRTYAALIRRTDHLIGALLDALDQTGFARTTAVALSSDHGEMLGAHGGLHQKWYNAFEETTRVPLIVRIPWRTELEAGSRNETLSSHVDIAPTLLGLAEIPIDDALPGRDLFASPDTLGSYFVTFDNILDGSSPEGAAGRRFPIVRALSTMRYPGLDTTQTAVEALVSRLPSEDKNGDNASGLWKIIRTFDPADVEGPSHYCLYDLDNDPAEQFNRYGDARVTPLFESMRRQLEVARAHYAINRDARHPATRD